MTYWLIYGLILIGGLCGLTYWLIRIHRQQRLWLENFLLITLSVFLTFMATEFYFKVFFAETNNLDTLARRNWRDRYYTGTFNSLGYRDQEWTTDMVQDKTKVMVLGDSFVEGVGIEAPADRFPNRLNDLLGEQYAVFVVAQRGWGTHRQLKEIVRYPYSPDILVLSYFINDIDDVARERVIEPVKMPEIPLVIRPLVNYSYAINFAYWRLYPMVQSESSQVRWQWRLRAYDDPDSWWLHQQDLLTLITGAKAQQLPLIVVVFPNLTDIEGSTVITQKVMTIFQQNDIPLINVADLVTGLSTDDLIASPVDAHPNELVHGLVAEALYRKFVELELAHDQ